MTSTTSEDSLLAVIKTPPEIMKSVLTSAEESLSPTIPTSSDEVIRKKKELAAEKKRAYRDRLDEEQKEKVRIKDAEKKAIVREEEKKSNII